MPRFVTPVAEWTVNIRSLSACATSVIFACRLVRVIDRLPAPVVNETDAFTGPPLVDAPPGVTNVMLFAHAGVANPPINAPVARIWETLRMLLLRTNPPE